MHPLKLRLFLLAKLPSAFFSGVRVHESDEERCVTTVPYKWFTRNPFRSTYFACLSMAAEMSTGVLALTYIQRRQLPVSLLVVKLEANYFKKAVGRSYFKCTDGALIKKTIDQAISTGEGTTVRACSIGTNKNGEVVAEFFITWSFKLRSNKP
jgi:hypothetical protein